MRNVCGYVTWPRLQSRSHLITSTTTTCTLSPYIHTPLQIQDSHHPVGILGSFGPPHSVSPAGLNFGLTSAVALSIVERQA